VEDATWDKLRALAGEYKPGRRTGFGVTGDQHDTANGTVGFLQAQNCTNLPSSWRHPESRDDSMSADYYQEIGRILESGKFHMAFFDDRLAMPDRYGNDPRPHRRIRHPLRQDGPDRGATAMGMATEKLGLASTCSTTYYEPFDVARRFATLDLMTGGRVAWNVVTSVNDGEAPQYGQGCASRS